MNEKLWKEFLKTPQTKKEKETLGEAVVAVVEQLTKNLNETSDPADFKYSLNQGDVVEGIFALAVGLYIFEGKIDAGRLNSLRKQVDPETWAGETKQTIFIGENKGQKGDLIKVQCTIRLKSKKTAGMAYGAGWDGSAPVKVNKIPVIMNKQSHLINDITKTNFLRDLVEWKEGILLDDKRDRVLFTVDADGKAGENEKGRIKGDVMVKIQASEITEDDLEGEFGKGFDGKELPFDTKAFSIKSDNVTMANRSPFVGMLEAAQWFGVLQDFAGCSSIPEPVDINTIPMNCAQQYLAIRRNTKENPNPANLIATREDKNKIAKKMWSDLKKLLIQKLQGNDKESKKKIFNYLIKAAFGEDSKNIIDMSKYGIKEIIKSDLEALMNDASLNVIPVDDGDTLKFYRKPKDGSKPSKEDLLYQFRTKISYGKKPRKATKMNPEGEYLEIKFYPEVGKLAYSEKDEEWYCKKYPSADGCDTIG